MAWCADLVVPSGFKVSNIQRVNCFVFFFLSLFT